MPAGGIKSMIFDIIVCGILPAIVYQILKDGRNWSELHALGAVIVFPLLGSVRDVWRDRTVNLISGLSLLGIAVSLVATWMGGDPKLLLVRESLLTVALAAACFVSLLAPKPLMYYFARAALGSQGGGGGAAVFERRYQESPPMRRLFFVITIAWGICFALEFLVKIVIVYTLSIQTVLIIGPILTNGVAVATLGFTFVYVRKLKGSKAGF